MTDPKNLFGHYFESSYSQANILSARQFEQAAEGFRKRYQDYLPDNKNAKILDIGCGTGHFLYFLKVMHYTNFYGIDLSKDQVDYCFQNISDQVSVSDLFDFLKNKQNIYDFIAMHDVLEHLPKPRILEALTLIHISLKKGGVFIVRVPNMSNPFSLDSRYSDFTHEAGFTEKSLYQVLFVSGFQSIEFLAPEKIQIRTFKQFLHAILLFVYHSFIRFGYYVQNFTVPKNLDKNITAVGKN